MFVDDRLAGSWPQLVGRIDQLQLLEGWAVTEPALAGVGSAAGLAWVSRDWGRARADAVLGALVRLAAADGGADPDALLVVLHVCSGWVLRMCGQLADLTPDVEQVVVGELACQVLRFPWRRRSRAFAANLQWDTRRGVLAEFRPDGRRRELPVDTFSDDWVWDEPIAGPGDAEDLDLADLLLWAVRSGLDPADLRLLVDIERQRIVCRGQDGRVAAAYGISPATLYRRRARTVAALRESARDYLAAVA